MRIISSKGLQASSNPALVLALVLIIAVDLFVGFLSFIFLPSIFSGKEASRFFWLTLLPMIYGAAKTTWVALLEIRYRLRGGQAVDLREVTK